MTSEQDEREIRRLLIEAARGAGHQIADLELLRIGNNYVYAERSHRLVLRVSLRQRNPDYLRDENTRIRRLTDLGAPLLGPLEIEPLTLPTGHLATIWPLGDKPEPRPAISLAPPLAKLHEVPPLPDLPTWAGFERGRYRLGLAREAHVPAALVDEVEAHLDYLQARFPAWSTATVVHGDPHTGNLVRLDGEHLLIDLDDLAVGCPEIDLAPLRCSYRRFDGIPGGWDRYLAAYDHAIDLDLLDWFVQLRQLTMVAWLFTLWNYRPESQAEAIHRVKTLNKVAKWNPL